MKNLLLLLVSLFPVSICAAEDGARTLMSPSPTMEMLSGQASAQPAAAATGEQSRIMASEGYTGEIAQAANLSAVAAGPLGETRPPIGDMTGPRVSPAPAVAPSSLAEQPSTRAPRKRKPPIDPKYIKGPLALGGIFAAIGLGLALTGGPGLAILAVGVVAGAGLGVGGLLYWLNKKMGG